MGKLGGPFVPVIDANSLFAAIVEGTVVPVVALCIFGTRARVRPVTSRVVPLVHAEVALAGKSSFEGASSGVTTCTGDA